MSINPQTDAEELVMALPSTASLLEALGLQFLDGDNPNIWNFDGSVQDLHDKLLSVIVRFNSFTQAVMRPHI